MTTNNQSKQSSQGRQVVSNEGEFSNVAYIKFQNLLLLCAFGNFSFSFCLTGEKAKKTQQVSEAQFTMIKVNNESYLQVMCTLYKVTNVTMEKLSDIRKTATKLVDLEIKLDQCKQLGVDYKIKYAKKYSIDRCRCHQNILESYFLLELLKFRGKYIIYSHIIHIIYS